MPEDFEVIELNPNEAAPGTLPDANPAAPPEPPQPPAPEPPSGESPSGTPPETPPAPAPPAPAPAITPNAQKRIDRLVAERERFRQENEALRAQLAGVQPPAPIPSSPVVVAPGAKLPPKEEDYIGKPYSEYVLALSDWRYDERRRQERIAENQQKIQREQNASIMEYSRGADEVFAEHPDYLEVTNPVVMEAQGALTPLMGTIISAAGEVGPKILYHLATNIEEAAKIAQMPPISQAEAIFKLKTVFSKNGQAPRQEVSSAPAPIVPLGNHPPAPAPDALKGMEMY